MTADHVFCYNRYLLGVNNSQNRILVPLKGSFQKIDEHPRPFHLGINPPLPPSPPLPSHGLVLEGDGRFTGARVVQMYM